MGGCAYYSVIPSPVLDCRELTDGAKLFYAEVARRVGQRGYCWASNQVLAEAMRTSERTISRYVAELEAAGFIECEIIGVSDRKRRAERRIRIPVPAAADTAGAAEVDNFGEDTVDNFGGDTVDNFGEGKVDKIGEGKVDKNGESLYRLNNKSLNNPLEPPSGGKRAPESAKWRPDRFEAFWSYYRQNVNPANRSAARRAWDRLRPDEDTVREIGLALARRLKNDAEWRRGIGRPHASTYLNGQMWLDEGPRERDSRAPEAEGAPPLRFMENWT